MPGSGGASDIAALLRRYVALLSREKARLPEKVHYITSPGYGPWREAEGLKQGGAAGARLGPEVGPLVKRSRALIIEVCKI